ncbi:MAG TPA: hypothetical protein ENK36_07485 [Desulfobacterales bacterium]|nr:hypothetical protein [Desulfobacterales bacterium]
MLTCIISGFIGFFCGLLGMSILASSSQAGLIEKESAMRYALKKVLFWYKSQQQHDFPETDIREALYQD